MIKVATLTLDVYDDSQGEIARTLSPECHQLGVAPAEEVENLPDREFGLVAKTAGDHTIRKFPLHTEDSRKLSQAYFAKTSSALPPEVAAVVEAKLSDPENVKVAHVDLTKVGGVLPSFPERFYGLALGDKNHFPLHDESLVGRAIERFPITTESMAPEHKFAYARNITKRASQLGVEVPTRSPINCYAGDKINLQSLAQAIQQRKMAVHARADVSTTLLDQLHQAAGCHPEQGEAETAESFDLRCRKVASRRSIPESQVIVTLQNFDKVAGLGNREYARGLLDPFAACFKVAMNVQAPSEVDGIDLGRISPESLQQYFDEGFIAQFMENPVQIYQTLPPPVKEILRSIASGRGPGSQAPQGGPEAAPTHSGDPVSLLNPTFADNAHTYA